MSAAPMPVSASVKSAPPCTTPAELSCCRPTSSVHSLKPGRCTAITTPTCRMKRAVGPSMRIQVSVRVTGSPSAEVVATWISSRSPSTVMTRESTCPTFAFVIAPVIRWVTVPLASSTS